MSTDLWSTTSICVNAHGERVLVKRKRVDVERRIAHRMKVLKCVVNAVSWVPPLAWFKDVYAEYCDLLNQCNFDNEKRMYHSCIGEKPTLHECTDARIVLQYIIPDEDCAVDYNSLMQQEIIHGVMHTRVTENTYVQCGGKTWVQEFNHMVELPHHEECIRLCMKTANPMKTPEGQAYYSHLCRRWRDVDGWIRLGDLYALDKIEHVPTWMKLVLTASSTIQALQLEK
jgi:hypothetical protein